MRSRKWDADKGIYSGLLFAGAPKLLTVIDDLCRRPWRYWQRKILPVVYLIRASGSANPLAGVAHRLNGARGRKVPYCRISGLPTEGVGPDDVAPVQQAFTEAVAGLSGRFRRLRRIRFPRYSLVTWLLSLPADGTPPDEPDAFDDHVLQMFANRLDRRHRRSDPGIADIMLDLPWWVRLPGMITPKIGMWVMRRSWWIQRWFAAHPAGVAAGGRFPLLIRAFAEGNATVLRPELLRALLADAFLEDLRRAYRLTSVLGAGRRRTVHTVLLIDSAGEGSAGLQVVRLVNQSRNNPVRTSSETWGMPYRWDPLLVVAVGDEKGRAALADDQIPDYLLDPTNAYAARDEWLRTVRRAGAERSWLLPFRVPEPGSPPPGVVDALRDTGWPTGRRPIIAKLLSVGLLLAGLAVAGESYQHCWSRPGEPALERRTHPNGTSQCIGLSSGRFRFFDTPPIGDDLDEGLKRDLRDVERRLHDNGERVRRLADHVTVVFLGMLTSADEEEYRSVLQELRGILVAQEDNRDGVPVRVLLANAGDGMEYGERAAEAVVREAESDPTLVAVVGLGISREGTRQAMIELGRGKVPMVGTVISATRLATMTTAYYHQVGPTNQREAQVAAHYAATALKAKRAAIYYSGDERDIYSADLREQAEIAFRAKGIPVSVEAFRVPDSNIGEDMSSLAARACDLGRDGIVFYAGRGEHLRDFLGSIGRRCEQPFPRIVAGDDVTLFVLNDGMRNMRGIRLDYMSFASSLAWGTDCTAVEDKVSFYSWYKTLFGEACISTRDGRAMLSYDALVTTIEAVRNAREDDHRIPSRDLLREEIGELSIYGEGAVHGASGVINYGRLHNSAVPINKAIMVLRAEGANPPVRVLLCGTIRLAEPADPALCPDEAS